MTHVCCPSCRLRFTAAAAARLEACPGCGEPPQFASAEGTVGFRLVTQHDHREALPAAIAVAMRTDAPRQTRS